MRDIFGRRQRGSEQLSESRALPGHTDSVREETPYTAVRPKNEGLTASVLPEIGEKMLSARQKDDGMRLFCRRHRSDRGARGRIKSGAKFWKIKSIVSQYVPAQAACYRALAAKKTGMQKKERNIARRPNAFLDA